jgi:putative protease
MQRPEVLAPAGGGAALRAAVRAGADAVYFGIERFSARQRAENLAERALGGWLEELHQQGVRGYLALNTLVFDHELRELGRVIGAGAEAGVDAVIVQELGVLRLVRAMAPSLPVHVSTQAAVVSAGELAAWQRFGARRVVLARELDCDTIARLRELTSLELEVFVHGALCISYSGQCLASAAFGGRSANRGECAQPCRLPYRLDGRSEAERLLSPSDLRASSWVARLADLGIDALKIEGRLKGPEYVAAAVRLYRLAVDAWRRQEPADLGPAERATEQSYSRGAVAGWFGGVDHLSLVDGGAATHRGVSIGVAEGVDRTGRRSWIRARLTDEVRRGDGLRVADCSGRVWAIRLRRGEEWSDVRRATADDVVRIWLGPEAELPPFAPGATVHKTDDPRLGPELWGQARRRLRLELRLRGGAGEAVWLEGKSEDGRRGEVPVAGELGPAPAGADIRWYSAKLGRLGDTPFVLAELVVDLPPGTSPPASALNRARRALVEVLRGEARRPHFVCPASVESLLADAVRSAALPPGLYVLVRRLDQVAPALAAGADGIYLELASDAELAQATDACRRRGIAVGRVTPRIEHASEPPGDADLWLVRTHDSGPRCCRCRLARVESPERRGAPRARSSRRHSCFRG